MASMVHRKMAISIRTRCFISERCSKWAILRPFLGPKWRPCSQTGGALVGVKYEYVAIMFSGSLALFWPLVKSS
jgi:hypothetical protein